MTVPRARLVLAWALIAGCVVGWPLSALTFASDEPRTVLGLSWVALIVTAVNVLLTTTVRNRQDDDDPEG